MTANLPANLAQFSDEALRAEIDLCLQALEDVKVRRRIVDAWLDYKIDGDGAMQALVGLGIIEFSPGAPGE